MKQSSKDLTKEYQQVSKLKMYAISKIIKAFSHKGCGFADRLQEFNGHKVENYDPAGWLF